MKNDPLCGPRRAKGQNSKQLKEDSAKHWLTQSIGNDKVGLMHVRPFTANSTYANPQHSKRLSFYRKFVNRSVNEEHKSIQQQKKQPHQKSLFLPYEYKIINQEEGSQRDKNCRDLKCSNDSSSKNKSFEGFLQSKRRNDSLKKQQKDSQSNQRQKVVKSTRLEQTQRGDRELNLSGKGIAKQSQQNDSHKFFMREKTGPNPEMSITRPECPFEPFTPSQRESSTITPFASFNSKQSKLSTIHSQAEKARAKLHYIRYTFQEDQGYVLFNKCPYGQQKQKKKAIPSSRRKLLLFNPKTSNKQTLNPNLQHSITRIQGWQAPTQDEDLLPK